jgi:hypothetical protein
MDKRQDDELTPFENESDDDFAEEHTPGPTDPPNAEGDAKGGEDEGYQPQTRV